MKLYNNSIAYVLGTGCLSFLLSACLSHGAQRSFNRFVQYQPYDAVIVPGVPFEGKEWSDIMKIRVHWAVYLYKQNITKNIIFSGSAVYSPWYESKIMGLYAAALGVDKEHILYENRAEHSSENLYYSYLIARKKGFKKIALTTDPIQNFFLRSFAHKIHLKDIAFMPIIYKKMRSLELPTPLIEPAVAKKDSFVSITEREDLKKRVAGTFGKHIESDPIFPLQLKSSKKKSSK